MKRLALTAAVLLAAALPAFGQAQEADKMKKELEKLQAEKEDLARQLDAQRKDLEKLRAQLEAARAGLAKSDPRPAEISRPPDPRAPQRGSSSGGWTTAAGSAAREGKVTAVATDVGLVVVSIGRDDGVREGQECTITRGADFVARAAVERADAKWSAARVAMKKSDPQVGDTVSVAAAPAAAPEKAAETLREIRRELDEIRRQVRELSDQLLPSWSRAGVVVEALPEDLRAHLGIENGLVVRRVREGSAAEKAGLKAHDVLPALTEAQLMEALEKGSKVRIVRQGREQGGSTR